MWLSDNNTISNKSQNFILYCSAQMDVTRQRDMSGFYRHLLRQTTGEEAIPDGNRVKQEVKGDTEVKVKEERYVVFTYAAELKFFL